MKGLGKRLLTSAVAIPLLVYLVGWAHWYYFAAVAFVAVLIGMWEFFKITLVEETPQIRIWLLFMGALTFAALFWLWQPPQLGHPSQGFPHHAPAGLFVYVLLFMLLSLGFLIARGNHPLSPIPSRVGLGFLGISYLTLLGIHIAFLGRLPDATDFQLHHGGWLFLLLVSTFGSDTGGYLFGKTIGGPKLYPAVSPNKTWAGFFGCIVGANLGAWIVQMTALPLLQWYDILIIGFSVAILGQAGDFFESLIKRAYKIKDSGNILPGHGGILDRIDALLFNGVFIFYYALWLVLTR